MRFFVRVHGFFLGVEDFSLVGKVQWFENAKKYLNDWLLPDAFSNARIVFDKTPITYEIKKYSIETLRKFI